MDSIAQKWKVCTECKRERAERALMSAAAPEVLQCIVARYNYAVDLQRPCSVQRAAAASNGMPRTTNTTHKMQRATCCAPRHDTCHTKHSAQSTRHCIRRCQAQRLDNTRIRARRRTRPQNMHARTHARRHAWVDHSGGHSPGVQTGSRWPFLRW